MRFFAPEILPIVNNIKLLKKLKNFLLTIFFGIIVHWNNRNQSFIYSKF